jgi:hypothetical protein
VLQARSLAISDPIKSKTLAEGAQQIALEAIAKTETEKTRLKGILSSEVASLVQEYSRDKITLGDIRKRINNPTYLVILQRMEIAGVCMRQAKEGLDKEQFDSFPALYARTKQRLSEDSSSKKINRSINYLDVINLFFGDSLRDRREFR